MIVLGLDFETTGLDFNNDRVIEVGAILYSTGQKKCLESEGFLVKSEVAISAKITKLTGVTQQAMEKFGFESDDSLDTVRQMMLAADAMIGHNVLHFDKNVLEHWARRHNTAIPDKLWIDTMIDIKDHEGKKLTLLAADHGFVNLFPHSALSDVQTVLTILSRYDIVQIVERAKTPTVIIQAHQNYHENHLVKEAKFRWNPQYKIWWKPVKETDIAELEQSVSFPIGFADKEILLENLNSN